MPPRGEDRVDQIGADARSGVHVQVVRAEGLDAVDIDVAASLPDAEVAAGSGAPSLPAAPLKGRPPKRSSAS
jgi:hypothetical protein